MAVYENINTEDYKTRFFDGESHLLLDVRTVEEFEQARIPGSVNIPLDELSTRVSEIQSAAGDQPIVVVCRTGVRSIMGAQILRTSGITNEGLYNLTRGVVGWAMNRWPLDAGPNGA